MSPFADQVRRGESPSIDDYSRRFPEMADEIRELFPLVMTLERLKIDKEVEILRRSLSGRVSDPPSGRLPARPRTRPGRNGIVFESIKEATGRRFAIKLLPWQFATDRPQWKELFTGRRRRLPGCGIRISCGSSPLE